MVASPRVSGSTALKSFRLRDVPDHIRIEAALAHSDELGRALRSRRGDGRGVHPREAFAAIEGASAVMQLALYPSDHVYRVSQDAWDAMLARAGR